MIKRWKEFLFSIIPINLIFDHIGHWQLQGYDIPIYTNTVYPFAFDPPRARRNGSWVMTACDLGLGAPSGRIGCLYIFCHVDTFQCRIEETYNLIPHMISMDTMMTIWWNGIWLKWNYTTLENCRDDDEWNEWIYNNMTFVTIMMTTKMIVI